MFWDVEPLWVFSRCGVLLFSSLSIKRRPELCWKDKLHYNMQVMKDRFGDEYSFWPDGYVLPNDWDKLAQYYALTGVPTPIILKPSRNAMGNGIRCITSLDQLSLDDEYVQKQIPLAQQLRALLSFLTVLCYVVFVSLSFQFVLLLLLLLYFADRLHIGNVFSSYILNPLLLDGYKISFRIYVLVSSLNPLRIYIYPNGLTRICSRRFVPTA